MNRQRALGWLLVRDGECLGRAGERFSAGVVATCLAVLSVGCSSGTPSQASNAAATGSSTTDGVSTSASTAVQNIATVVASSTGMTPLPVVPAQTAGSSSSSATSSSATSPAPAISSIPTSASDPATGGGPSSEAPTAAVMSGDSNSIGMVDDTTSEPSNPGPSVSEDATIVPDPAWACGMPDGIPAPTLGTFAFTISYDISAEHDVGQTPYGHRRLLDVSGGTISGERLQGSVLTGGLEYELTLANGVVEYQGINVLTASDGSRIFVRSCGVAADEGSPSRIIPDFEATTNGSNAFLNTGKWVATREVTGKTMKLDVYDVSNVTAGEPRVALHKPEGVPPQPWECNTTKGQTGPEVLTENVTLGTSFSINNAKYGSRNVIPITGGTTTGRVKGRILNGGADYQLSGSLDAWYTLAPDNGEFILVRNCGAANALIPWFEAAVDGDYDFLNTNAYLSSAPDVGGGAVSITFYERQ